MNSTEELFKKQREIGPAIWLLTLYWSQQDSDECSWAWVNAGAPMDDDAVASHLCVSVFTAKRWREKLRRAGMISVFPREHGFSVFAYRPPFAGRLLEILDEPRASEVAWPAVITTMVQ
jgi:hypothetical protein